MVESLLVPPNPGVVRHIKSSLTQLATIMRLIKRNALITNVEIIETNLALAPGFHRAGNTQPAMTCKQHKKANSKYRKDLRLTFNLDSRSLEIFW